MTTGRINQVAMGRIGGIGRRSDRHRLSRVFVKNTPATDTPE